MALSVALHPAVLWGRSSPAASQQSSCARQARCGRARGAEGRAGSAGLGASPEWRFLEPRSPLRARPRDIAFYLVEGDFQVDCGHPFLA